jgi:hypothetical protein
MTDDEVVAEYERLVAQYIADGMTPSDARYLAAFDTSGPDVIDDGAANE